MATTISTLDTLIEATLREPLSLARNHLGRAAELKPNKPAYQYAFAQAEFLAGEYAAVQAACEKNLQLPDNTNYNALLLLGEVQLRAGRPTEAWKTAQRAISINKQLEDAWLLAARASVKSGEYFRASRFLEMFLTVNRDKLPNPLIHIQLARVHLETDAPQQALEQLEQAHARLKALAILPGPAFMSLRARILNRLEQRTEALEYYQRALQLAPQDAALHNEMGKALQDEHRFDEALKYFRHAIQLEPTNARYFCNAGIAALQSAEQPGQFSRRIESLHQQAIELLTKATKLDSSSPMYWYELAMAHLVLRNYRAGKSALGQALSQLSSLSDSNLTRILYLQNYAQVCQKLGDYEDARQALSDLLKLQHHLASV